MKRYQGINLLYFPFRQKIMAGLEDAWSDGIPVRIFETFRTRQRQSAIYAQGRTTEGPIITRAMPGHSYHNYGIAVDLVMYVDGKWDWSDTALYRKLGPYFQRYGVRWLGDTTGDLVHYQMITPYGVRDLQEIYDEGGLEKVWMILDEVRLVSC